VGAALSPDPDATQPIAPSPTGLRVATASLLLRRPSDAVGDGLLRTGLSGQVAQVIPASRQCGPRAGRAQAAAAALP
jgi:hypothetical protein